MDTVIAAAPQKDLVKVEPTFISLPLPPVTVQKVSNEKSILRLLEKYGFTEHQRRQVLKSQPIPKELTLSRNDKFVTKTYRGGNKFELRLYHPSKPEAYTFWRLGQDAGLQVSAANFERKTVRAEGRVKGSLVGSVIKATGSEDVAYRFLDAYQLRYARFTKQIQRGAAFVVFFEELYDEGKKIKTGEVLKTSLEISGKLDVRHFIPFNEGGAFVSKADDQSDRKFYSPVGYIKISSLFQPRRMHPITRKLIPHLGADFEIDSGEPVFAIGSGVVRRFGKSRGSGKFVVIDHGGNLMSYYNHLSEIGGRIRIGLSVAAGEEIAKVGCTGYCTKPHLHLSITKNNRFVDPLPYIRTYPFNQKQLISRMVASLTE